MNIENIYLKRKNKVKVSDKDWKVFSISEIFNKIYIAKSQDFGKMKKKIYCKDILNELKIELANG